MNLTEYLKENKVKIIDNSIILPNGDWELNDNVLTLKSIANPVIKECLLGWFFCSDDKQIWVLKHDDEFPVGTYKYLKWASEEYTNFKSWSHTYLKDAVYFDGVCFEFKGKTKIEFSRYVYEPT